MAIPKGQCCSTINLPNFGRAFASGGSDPQPLPIPATTVWTIIYKIGTTTIAGSTPTVSITFTAADNPSLTSPGAVAFIQARINADPTFVAYQATPSGSGTTITVDSLTSTSGLTVTICKPSTSSISDLSEGIFDVVSA